MARYRCSQWGSRGFKRPDLTLHTWTLGSRRVRSPPVQSTHAASSHQSGQGSGRSGSERQTEESQPTCWRRDSQLIFLDKSARLVIAIPSRAGNPWMLVFQKGFQFNHSINFFLLKLYFMINLGRWTLWKLRLVSSLISHESDFSQGISDFLLEYLAILLAHIMAGYDGAEDRFR